MISGISNITFQSYKKADFKKSQPSFCSNKPKFSNPFASAVSNASKVHTDINRNKLIKKRLFEL